MRRAALLVLLLATAAAAHPLAPVLLELEELAGGRARVRWREPALRPLGQAPAPRLPAGCRPTARVRVRLAGAALERRWTVACGAGGLVGAAVGVDGLGATATNALVRVRLRDGRVARTLLDASSSTFTVPAREDRAAVAGRYLALGVGHLLGGPDHLLFLLGLVLLVRGGRRLAGTVTAFTVGHTATLALAVLGLVGVPPAPVEVAIAATIALLAAELATGAPSALGRRPGAMALGFGLLHGLGFAGALAEVGVPAGDIPLALAAFNVGIEVAQLACVAALLALRPLTARLPAGSVRWPAWAMGSIAAMWCLERVAALLSAA